MKTMISTPEKLLVPIKYFYHESFKKPATVLAKMPNLAEYEEDLKQKLLTKNEYSPELRPCCSPVLTREQEFHLFRKMNYFKYRASKLSENLPKKAGKKRIAIIEEYLLKASEVRSQIASCNFRLAPSICRRYNGNLEDSYLDIIVVIDKFDYTLGNKFSTYATYALRNNLFTRNKKALNNRVHFIQSTDATFNSILDREDTSEQERIFNKNKVLSEDILIRFEKKATLREIIAVKNWFGIGCEKRTLQEVGKELKLTKERIRQLRENGIRKIREIVKNESL